MRFVQVMALVVIGWCILAETPTDRRFARANLLLVAVAAIMADLLDVP